MVGKQASCHTVTPVPIFTILTKKTLSKDNIHNFDRHVAKWSWKLFSTPLFCKWNIKIIQRDKKRKTILRNHESVWHYLQFSTSTKETEIGRFLMGNNDRIEADSSTSRLLHLQKISIQVEEIKFERLQKGPSIPISCII